MEMEKEKKDKLAAARKKLNEYKLNRSAAKPATTSSKPADVPMIYQNINSQPPACNIFNPAGGENNNIPANPFFVPTSTGPLGSPLEAAQQPNNPRHEVPSLPSYQYPVQQPFHQEAPPSFADSVRDHNTIGILPIPFSTPAAQSTEPEVSTTAHVFQSLAEREPSRETFQEPVINPIADLPEHPDQNSQHPQDIPQDPASSLHLQSASYFFERPTHDSSDHDCQPSAPTEIDLVSSTVADGPEETRPVSGAQHIEAQILNPVDAFSTRTERVQTDQNDFAHVFASSLFSTCGSGGSELDGIFNLSANEIPPVTFTPVMPLIESNPENSLLQESHQSTEVTPPSFTSHSLPDSTVNSTDVEAYVGVEAHEESVIMKKLLLDLDPAVENPVIQSPLLPYHNNNMEVVNTLSQNEGDQVAPGGSGFQSGSESLSTHVNHPEKLIQEPENVTNLSQAPTATSENSVAYQQMKSMQEAMELQIEELRKENAYLLNRQTELTFKIEDSERLAHEFKLERDRVKEEAMTMSQALRGKINSLCEENQRIVKNSTEVGVDLRATLEEKTQQLEEMQKAVIIVSQSKMDFAGRLDHEVECVKELQGILKERDEEIAKLRSEKSSLEERLRHEQQKDAVIHQLQDQTRHYQVQCETLQREMLDLKRKFNNVENELTASNPSKQSLLSQSQGSGDGSHIDQEHGHPFSPTVSSSCSHEHGHDNHDQSRMSPSEVCHSHDHGDHSHAEHHGDHDHAHEGHVHEGHHHGHEHEHGEHHHDHDHGEHHHDHDNGEHHHDHDHGGHHHSHNHDGHGHSHNHADHEYSETVIRRGPTDEVTELKKTLHRLQWENSTYRNEIDILAVDAKQKRSYEDKCAALEEENERMRKEVEQLEHVIIQLQGENDTIGDYITLYQTQKMALKECAKEKDAQLELLAKEREILLHRLAELTTLVKELRDSKSENNSVCADDHTHELSYPAPNNKRQIEGQIRNLLSEIGSSTLIENFHPCAVCSGRLMTV